MICSCGAKVVSELTSIKHQQEMNFDWLCFLFFLKKVYELYIYCSCEQLEMCEKSASRIYPHLDSKCSMCQSRPWVLCQFKYRLSSQQHPIKIYGNFILKWSKNGSLSSWEWNRNETEWCKRKCTVKPRVNGSNFNLCCHEIVSFLA